MPHFKRISHFKKIQRKHIFCLTLRFAQACGNQLTEKDAF